MQFPSSFEPIRIKRIVIFLSKFRVKWSFRSYEFGGPKKDRIIRELKVPNLELPRPIRLRCHLDLGFLLNNQRC